MTGTLTYELEAKHDGRKSFYGKAKVRETDCYLRLTSYGTLVAEVDKVNRTAKVYGSYSQTTLRHIREFLKQNGFTANDKTQILNDYCK